MNDMKWAFELYDKMSANADTMTAALARLDKQLGLVNKDSKTAQNAFAGFSGPIGTMVGGLRYAAGVALDLGLRVADLGISFGKAGLEAIGFKESTLVSLKALTGTMEGAQNVFERSMKFADLTPFGTKDVVQQMKMIMGAGFKQERAEDIFAALSDVAAVSGGGAPAMQGMLVQMAQAKAIGKFQMQDLKAIMSHAGPAGVSMGALFDQLAATTGRNRAGISEDLSAGRIDAEQGIQALLEVIQRDVSKGKLGQASLDQGQSISGLISTIESFPEKLFYGINLDSAGVAGLKKFLTGLISAMDTLVGKGGRLTTILQGWTDSVGSFLGSLDPQQILGFVNTAIDGIQMFAGMVRTGWASAVETFNLIAGSTNAPAITFADTMRYLGTGVQFVMQVMATLAGLLALVFKGWDLLINGVDYAYLWEQFKQLGTNIIDGLKKGLLAGLDAIKKVLDVLSGGMISNVENALGIHSPSKVFAEIGRQTTAGFVQGINRSLPEVNRAFGGLATPEAGGKLSAGAARQVSVSFGEGSIQIRVEGGNFDEEGLVRHIAEIVPAAVQKLFGELALESGEPA